MKRPIKDKLAIENSREDSLLANIEHRDMLNKLIEVEENSLRPDPKKLDRMKSAKWKLDLLIAIHNQQNT